MKRIRLLPTIALALGLFATSSVMPLNPVQAQGLLTKCETEIAANCADVAKGRGRITACLYAYGSDLSGECKTEVDKFSKKIPKGALSLQGTEYETALRKVCTSDAVQLCSGVRIGKARILACLYSRTDRVSKACSSESKRVLDEVK